MDKTVGCALAGQGLWATYLGAVAIDWVAGRFGASVELARAGLNVQSSRDELQRCCKTQCSA